MSQLNFKYYNHLGFHNPYFIVENGKIKINNKISEFLTESTDRTLDFTAVVEIISTGYAFGDRTLIKEIKKTPWMGKPNPNFTDWDFFNLPRHQENKIDEKEVAEHFYVLLEQELLGYVSDHHHIGILLTGGMDSRIVAAVLSQLIQKNQLSEIKVTAYTWGLLDSRDVIYAERIAKLLDWEWKHMDVDTTQMEQNYEWVTKNGCEFTPLHLHAMSKVAAEQSLDCVLAGSFGDSIGRGEYSGVKAENLKSLDLKIKNVGNVLRGDYKALTSKDIKQDINEYHRRFPEEKAYQQNELDMQLHYMRRMLNPCMSIIDQKIPLYQMFSSPEVFSYMWSLDPECRTDRIYFLILENYAPELLDIPWARKGVTYLSENERPDNYKKRHHQYGDIIRNNFIGLIESKITQHSAIASQIFNLQSLKTILQNIKKYPIKNYFFYEEKLLWIAALLEFIYKYDIKVVMPADSNKDLFNSLKENLSYKAKYLRSKFN